VTPSLLAHPQLLSPALLLFGGHGEIWRRKVGGFSDEKRNAVPGRGDSQKAAAKQTGLKLGQPFTPEGSSQVRKWLSDNGVNHCKPKKEHVFFRTWAAAMEVCCEILTT
jgi:hypothetical protein